MKLQELADAYNALRNDALGRGTTPIVSPLLAAKVGNIYDRFRTYMGNAGVLDDIFADATAYGWVKQYQDLAAEVQREGKLKSAPNGLNFKSKLQDVTEDVSNAAQYVANEAAKMGQAIVLVVAAIGLPLLFVVMGGARRR